MNMENLKEKIEELLKTKIIKVSTLKTYQNNDDDNYEISIAFNGNLIEMKSLFDCNECC